MKKMKKLLVALLLVVMCLSLVACGGGEENPADGGSAPVADNNSTSITDEEIAALTEAYNTVAPLYNEAYVQAEANGWLADETVAAEIEALNNTLGFIGAALTEDVTMLDGSDMTALVETVASLEGPLNDLVAKVSVPFEA